MKISIAKTAGFCMGVHRVVGLAVDMTTSTSQTIYSLGPLIHNNQTLEMLRERGIQILDENNPPSDNSTVLIRAHGVPPQIQNKYTSENYSIIDGTCPKVKTVHKVIKKYRDKGYSIVIAGDKGHAEVIGLLGYAGNAGYLIQQAGDVDALPDLEKVCLVSQTTFSRKVFDEISDHLRKRYKNAEIIVKKTICSATDKRQEEVLELAKSVDLMIVVGGKNSANTLRLAGISRETGTSTLHIETEEEISWENISKYENIGITAGASTPGWMIKRVADHLLFLDRTNKETFTSKLSQIFEILANINFFVAAGGVTMYYASTIFQEFDFEPVGALISFLYLMSIYLWNSLACIEKNKHLDISRYRFYNASKAKLTILALGCIACLLIISFIQSLTLFTFMLLPTFAGIIYQFTIVPRPFRKIFKYSNLKDIPTSRDLFAALAWAVVITFIPQAVEKVFILNPTTIAIFLWTFFLAYLRALIFDLRDIEGDRIMGRETLITIIGEKRVKRLIFSTLLMSFLILTGLSGVTFLQTYQVSNAPFYTFLLQLPVLLHIWAFMKWQHKLKNSLSAIFNVLADGQFYIAGLGAWIVVLVG
jgi:4-hydroxy-3-methylbut-2-enyl diphosphate reductase